MSVHPNAILLLVLKPDDLARKTYRAIVDEAGASDGEIRIDGRIFYIRVMESDYLEGFQIAADEGDIVVFEMVTYGYGERIAWDDLETRKQALDEWAAGVCSKHKCKSTIYVTANYW